MNRANYWIFIDDKLDEANSFADKLMEHGEITIEAMLPSDGRDCLLSSSVHPLGVLMDVNLSDVKGELGTGPGFAQDIRVKQRSKEIPEYPVVRFSGKDPVKQKIGGDPTSNDLFDLMIYKEEVKYSRDSIVRMLNGVSDIYSWLGKFQDEKLDNSQLIQKSFGLSEPFVSGWGHDDFFKKFVTSAKVGPHVASSLLLRTFLDKTGLLIDELLLAVRLGIDIEKSGDAWFDLLGRLQTVKYRGVGSDYFDRWWARGLDDWWYSEVKATDALVSCDVVSRVEQIANWSGLTTLISLKDGEVSTFRPWYFCQLGLEQEPPQRILIDPRNAIKISTFDDFYPWVDSAYASLKLAAQFAKEDPRLDSDEVDCLIRAKE